MVYNMESWMRTFTQRKNRKGKAHVRQLPTYLIYLYIVYISNGLNLLYPPKDMAKMVIVFCVSPIVPEGLVLVDMSK